MPYRRFVAYNAIGAVAWCASLLAAGYLFGGIRFVNAHIELMTIGIVILSLAPAAVALVRSRLRANPRLAIWLISGGAVACALAAVALADSALEGDGLAARDTSITSAVVAHRSDAWTSLAQAASLAGGEVSIALLSLAVIAGLMIARRRREAVIFAVAMSGTAVLVVGIKHLIMRSRPGQDYLLGPVDHGYSFPSGHTLFSAVFLSLVVWLLLPHLAPRWRPLAVGTALLLGFAVGASRVYLGYHWTTDVLASWLIATAWLGLLYVALRVIDRSDPDRATLSGSLQARHETLTP